VRAALGVHAGIIQSQASDGSASHQMLRDNGLGVLDLHVSVPDSLGIDHHHRAVFALVETAGFVDPHRAARTREVRCFRKLLKLPD